MEKSFICDNHALIKAVENYPCLWDKTSEDYKDKFVRKRAWFEVCQTLDPESENLSVRDQDDMCKTVMTKWVHLRDSFLRSLKCRPGGRPKKKYLHYNEMKFIINKTHDEDDALEGHDESQEPTSEQIDSDEPSTSRRNRRKRLLKRKISREQDIQPLQETLTKYQKLRQDHIDDDHAFLISLLPTLSKINEEDKIYFRIEVMQIVNKYCNHDKFNIKSSPNPLKNF